MSSYEKAPNCQIKSCNSRSLIEESTILKNLKQLEFSIDSKESVFSTDTLIISRTTFNQIIYIIENVGRVSYERRMYQQAILKMIDYLKEDLIDFNSQQRISDLIEKVKVWKDNEVSIPKKKEGGSSNYPESFTTITCNSVGNSKEQQTNTKKKPSTRSSDKDTKPDLEKRINKIPVQTQKNIDRGYDFYNNDPISDLIKQYIKMDLLNFINFKIEYSSSKEYDWTAIKELKQLEYTTVDLLICFGFAMLFLVNNPIATTELLYQYIYEVLNKELSNKKPSIKFKKAIVENATHFCNELVESKEGESIKLIYVWGGIFYLLNFHQLMSWRFLKIERVLKCKEHLKCFFDILSICLQYFEKEDEILKELMQNKVILDNWEIFKIAYNEYSLKV